MVFDNSARVAMSELIQPKLDPDLQVPGVTPVQVLASTRFVVPAIEVIDSRIEGWKIKLCDTIADNASSARVVLGGPPRHVTQLDLRLIGMVMEKNGELAQTGAGAAVLGHPANAVGRFGVSLKAGEIIMPGALSAAVDRNRGRCDQSIF